MNKNPLPQDSDLLAPALTPLLGFYEMQHDLIKLNLAATAEVSRQSLQILDPGERPVMPAAPMQLFSFFTDCLKLSMSPMSLLAASAMPTLGMDRKRD